MALKPSDLRVCRRSSKTGSGSPMPSATAPSVPAFVQPPQMAVTNSFSVSLPPML